MAKAPDYRLRVLYDLREKAKKTAEENYAKAKATLVRQQEKLATMEKQLVDMRDMRAAKTLQYFEELRINATRVDKIKQGQAHIDGLKIKEEDFSKEIEVQQQVVFDAEQKVEEMLQAMNKATQDFKALEKHKDKWAAGVKKERERQDENTTDDISQAQYFSQHHQKGRT